MFALTEKKIYKNQRGLGLKSVPERNGTLLLCAHIVEISSLDLIWLCAVEHDIDQLRHEDVESKADGVDGDDFIGRQIQDRGGREISPVNVDKSKKEPEQTGN